MASEMMDALKLLCEEKGIDQLYLLDRLEKTLAKSYQDSMHMPFGGRVTIDRTTGNIYVYEKVPVGEPNEEGDYEEFIEEDVTPKDASRNAAMAVKNEINEIVHMAGREQICAEFSDRIGEIITATVLQSTPDFTIVKIRDGVEAELPHYSAKKIKAAAASENGITEPMSERPKDERYTHNQRIKAVIIGVRDPNTNRQPVRGDRQKPPVIISRTTPELILRLLELEVPEIYEGVVKVKAITRDPGERAKVAVMSLDEKLDPVGACVGPKGNRIRAVVSELRGERVDVVLWDKDPAKFIANALSPAKVSRVIIDNEDDRNFATVIVPDDQLSLTIGKEGQNARLAARLTGYHIDIKSESMANQFMDLQDLEDDNYGGYDAGDQFVEDEMLEGAYGQDLQSDALGALADQMVNFDNDEAADDSESLI